jgi:mRNA interferase RelE/StbE
MVAAIGSARVMSKAKRRRGDAHPAEHSAWDIAYTKPARKDMMRLPPPAAESVRAALRRLAQDPLSRSVDIKKLKGEANLWRLRVGRSRALFDRDKANLRFVVFKIDDRKDVY